jgi:hypothetical protein
LAALENVGFQFLSLRQFLQRLISPRPRAGAFKNHLFERVLLANFDLTMGSRAPKGRAAVLVHVWDM